MTLTAFVLYGLLYALLGSLALLLIALNGPRLMLEDYPKQISQAVAPKTKAERQRLNWVGIPFVAILVGFPLLVGLIQARQDHADFWTIMRIVWGLMLFFNVYDLLVIDWLIVCFITPKIVVIPGTEGNLGYKNYWFHFIGFLKGTGITFLISSLISLLINYMVMT